MNDIAWRKIKCQKGAASKVPAALKQILLGRSYLECSELLVHSGKWEGSIPARKRWVEASAPAVRWLIEHHAKAKDKPFLWAFVAELAGGVHEDGWLSDPLDDSYEPIDAVLNEKFDVIKQVAEGKESGAAAGAAMVLCLAPDTKAAEKVLLRLARKKSAHATVRASALLGLSRVASASGRKLIEACARDQGLSDLVRGAAGLALLRLEPMPSLKRVSDALEAWFRLPATFPDDVPLGWFGIGIKQPLRSDNLYHDSSWAFHSLCRRLETWAVWREQLLRLGLKTSEPMVRRAIGDLLYLHEFDDDQVELLKADELSEAQLAILKKIGRHPICMPARAGIPAAGPSRRRYFGWAKGSVLETPVKAKNGRLTEETLTTMAARRGRSYLPEFKNLPGAEKWRVLAELNARLYHGCGLGLDDKELERAITEAVADPKLKKVAPKVLDEIASWYAEGRAQGTVPEMWSEVSELLLVPVARLGVVLKAEWVPLFPRLLRREHCVELIGVLPAGQRDEWLANNKQDADVVLELLPTLTTKLLPKRYLMTILEEKSAGPLDETFAAIEERIRELAKEKPHFKKAIREAEKAVL